MGPTLHHLPVGTQLGGGPQPGSPAAPGRVEPLQVGLMLRPPPDPGKASAAETEMPHSRGI